MNLSPVAGLTLWEPYASLIAVGAKRIETRSWPAPSWAIGQPIAIHAAKRFTAEQAEDVLRCRWVLKAANFEAPADWPAGAWTVGQVLGCVVCVAVLQYCGEAPVAPTPLEAEFGSFGAGRFGWHLGEVMQLSNPVPWVGRQGLWAATAKLREAIQEARYQA